MFSLALFLILAIFPVVSAPDSEQDLLKHYLLAGVFAFFSYA